MDLNQIFNRTWYQLPYDQAAIDAVQKLDPETYYFVVNGHVVYSTEELSPESSFQIHFRLNGGKGGFGSLLKSFKFHRSQNQLMMRNLNGRRLNDVREEERLRKWISKTNEREKEKVRKKKEKYEKLKNGGKTKHQFEDQEYLHRRDRVLDEMEDAVEAGVKALKEKKEDSPGPSTSREVKVVDETTSGSESEEFEVQASVPLKKRKAAPVACDLAEKKPKFSEAEPLIAKPAAKKGSKVTISFAKKQPEPHEKAPEPVAPKEFPAVELDGYETAKELEGLGLDHLKHALEARGLKCGGSLHERANRLFSIKGLTPDQYPKNIKAPPKKK